MPPRQLPALNYVPGNRLKWIAWRLRVLHIHCVHPPVRVTVRRYLARPWTL